MWIPSIKTIAGGVNVFAGLHLWTADTQSVQERADWAKKLGDMAALQPATVIPGHACPARSTTPRNSPAARPTWRALSRNCRKAANSGALIEAMKKAYPEAGLGIALDIGAKVNKGEMKW